MRRIVFGTLFLFACGGSDSGNGTTPPITPPPVTPVPTQLVVQAGDGQQGEPGSALAIRPTVVVRDQNGNVLPGVTVGFAVDSGGGTLQATGVVTASDGTASAGIWTLGSTEGRNVMRATVGTLAPVRLAAVARVTPVTLTAQPVSTTGGTLTLVQPGSQANGLTLTIPAGALNASGTVTFSIASGSTVTLPAGMTALAPAVTIASTASALSQLALLRYPVAVPAGKVRALVAADLTTGALTLLPAVTSDASSMTVALGSFDASTYAAGGVASAASALRFSNATAPTAPVVVPIAIDPSLLAGDFDSGYRPTADNWAFRRQLISKFPEGTSAALVDPAGSMVATSLWFFLNRKTTTGALYRRFEEAPSIAESARRGLRWVAVASDGLPDLFGPGAIAQTSAAAYATDPAGTAQGQYLGIKAAFLLSRNAPQPIYLMGPGAGVDDPRYGVAFRTEGNDVLVASPDDPAVTFRITLTPAGWTSFNVTTNTGRTYTVTSISTVTYGAFVNSVKLAAQWPRVVSGTIGQAEGWPTPTLQYKDGVLDTASVFLLDSLQLWWECGACADHGYRNAAIPSSPTKVQLFRSATLGPSTWGPLTTTQFGAQGISVAAVPALSTFAVAGYALYQPGVGSSGGFVNNPAWIDWITVKYKRLPVELLPDSVVAAQDTTVTFTVSAPGVPAGVRYRWRYSGLTTDSIETTAPTLQKQLTERGRSRMVVTVLEGPTKRPIGRDSVPIAIADLLVWRFDSVAVTRTGDLRSNATRLDTGYYNTRLNATNAMLSIPGDNFVISSPRAIVDNGAVILQTLPGQGATFTGTNGYPASFGFLNGVATFPRFAIGALGNGTLTGEATVFDFSDPDYLDYRNTITATMTPGVLRGAITMAFPGGVFRVTFRAKQILP